MEFNFDEGVRRIGLAVAFFGGIIVGIAIGFRSVSTGRNVPEGVMIGTLVAAGAGFSIYAAIGVFRWIIRGFANKD